MKWKCLNIEQELFCQLFFNIELFYIQAFSGKNPTSPLWPIYVISIAFAIHSDHRIYYISPFTRDTISMFVITLFMCFIVRAGHNKRKTKFLGFY